MFTETKDGNHSFYVIQGCKTKESEWLVFDKMHKVKEEKWFNMNWDSFGFVIHPFNLRTGEQRYKASHEDYSAVRQTTGYDGFYNLSMAKRAIKRLEKGSETGKFNYEHQGKVHQIYRYKFRIVRIIIIKQSFIVYD